MEGATRSTMSYLDKLAKFHRQQGTTFTRPPSLDGRPIDFSISSNRSSNATGGPVKLISRTAFRYGIVPGSQPTGSVW